MVSDADFNALHNALESCGTLVKSRYERQIPSAVYTIMYCIVNEMMHFIVVESSSKFMFGPMTSSSGATAPLRKCMRRSLLKAQTEQITPAQARRNIETAYAQMR